MGPRSARCTYRRQHGGCRGAFQFASHCAGGQMSLRPSRTVEKTYMKNNLRRYLAVVIPAILTVTAMTLTGCKKQSAGSSGGANGKTVVGFSQMENDGPWRIAETSSMKSEAARLTDKFDLVVTDAQGQTSKQVSDVEDLVSRGVDAIFLAPRERNGLEPALQAAKEA